MALRSVRPPKLSAMAAVKYAPPAMPPRKKYQMISRCQPGLLSMLVPLAAPLPEGHDSADAHRQRGADGEEGVHDDVALGQQRLLGEVVRGRFVQQQEERVEATERPVGVRPVELRVPVPHLLELGDPRLGLLGQLVAEAELDG